MASHNLVLCGLVKKGFLFVVVYRPHVYYSINHPNICICYIFMWVSDLKPIIKNKADIPDNSDNW